MPGTTKNGYFVEHGTQNPYAPKTKTSLVDDIAKNQALSQTLVDTPDREALGYPAFSTVTDYAVGDKVYYNNKLWKFKVSHAAGAWNAAEVDPWSTKQEDAELEQQIENLDERKANTDGSYPEMTVGKADNLTGEPIPVTTGYTLKPTGYDPTQPEIEVADGQVNMTEIQGRAVAWNQLFQQADAGTYTSHGVTVVIDNNGRITASGTNDGVVTILLSKQFSLIVGHKYYVRCNNVTSESNIEIQVKPLNNYFLQNGNVIVQCTSTSADWIALRVFGTDKVVSLDTYIDLFDLTLLCPQLASDANLTVAQVEEYLASLMTPKPWYKQNAGQLLGARMLGWQLRKTANLLNPTTKQARLFSYAYTGHDNEYTVNGLPSDAAVKFIEDKVGDNLPEVTNLVTNGDFSNGTTGWSCTDSAWSINDGIVSFNTGQLSQIDLNIINGHKYLFYMYAKTNGNYRYYFATSTSQYASSAYAFNKANFEYIKNIMVATNDGTTIKVGSGTGASGINLTGVKLYDLTTIFGAGNEPATVAEAEWMLFGILTPDSNNHFVIPSQGTASVINAGSMQPYDGDLTRANIIATWDGSKDGEVVAYAEDAVQIDSANIYYDNNGVKTQVFEGGVMRSTGDGAEDVRDKVYFDEIAKKWKAEVKVGDIDLGSLSWGVYGEVDIQRLRANDVASAPVRTDNCKYINARYTPITDSEWSTKSKVGLYVGASYLFSNPRFLFYDGVHSGTDLVDGHASWLDGVHCFYELATPVVYTSDLYYQVAEGQYVPLEEAFPNGIHGLCCNWASENLVEQADDANGQPQSITPQTTEVFQSDMKELLKTIGDTYISKEQAKDSFDNLLSALNTNSGTALGGTYATDGFNADGEVQFTFTPAAQE